jgi:hypothetical protein
MPIVTIVPVLFVVTVTLEALAVFCVAVQESQQFVVPSMQPSVRSQSDGKAIQLPSLLIMPIAF